MYIISQDGKTIVNSDNVLKYEIYSGDEVPLSPTDTSRWEIATTEWVIVTDYTTIIGVYDTCEHASNACSDLLKMIIACPDGIYPME